MMTKLNEVRVPEEDGAAQHETHSRENDGAGGEGVPRARVLLVDDDSTVRRSFGEDLEEAGFQVDRAETTLQARQFLIARPTYHAVFVDIMLRSDDVPGDRFILNNLELLRGTRVTAITAATNSIDQDRLAALESAGVGVIYKQPGLRQRLIDVVEEQVTIRDQQTNPPSNIQKAALMSMLEQILLEWLRSRSDPTKKRVYYGGRLYSYSDIAAEIERGTELGNAHLKMMANLFKRQMNLD